MAVPRQPIRAVSPTKGQGQPPQPQPQPPQPQPQPETGSAGADTGSSGSSGSSPAGPARHVMPTGGVFGDLLDQIAEAMLRAVAQACLDTLGLASEDVANTLSSLAEEFGGQPQ